jgi:hypothetical protein
MDEYAFKGIAFEDETRDSTVPPDATHATVAFTVRAQRAARKALPAEEVVEVGTYKRDGGPAGAAGAATGAGFSQWQYAGIVRL